MSTFRTYGSPPYTVAVIHGGPGAGGEMAPVARELADSYGILEPIQTADTLAGQVDELKEALDRNMDLPGTLIGYSWGAWLSFIIAAEYPELVKKVILVSSGPFEAKYAAGIMDTRLNRLNPEEKKETAALLARLGDPSVECTSEELARFGILCGRADAYDPLPHTSEVIECNADIYANVWKQGAELRRSGALLKYGDKISCPVIAIHGDYDPHPVEGVQIPLTATVKDFTSILLKNCGHTPWLEREARHEFYRVVQECLRPTGSA